VVKIEASDDNNAGSLVHMPATLLVLTEALYSCIPDAGRASP
jgi:hypothetical protein